MDIKSKQKIATYHITNKQTNKWIIKVSEKNNTPIQLN